MKSLRNSIYALGIAGLTLLPIKSEAGTLAGKVTDMFSNSPYNNINVTLVNDSGDVYETSTGLPPTAVEPNSWGLIKNSFNIRSPKINALEAALEGTYSLDLPDGTYTLAFTDGKPAIVKPTSQDLFNLQFNPSKRTVPRALRVKFNGDTRYDEKLLPKDFDLEYAWIVLDRMIRKVDYNSTTFNVDSDKVRKKHREDPNGKNVNPESVNTLISAIKEVVNLDGEVNPSIEIGANIPEFVPGKNGLMRVPIGNVFYFWDSDLPLGFAGAGARWLNEEETTIESSLGRFLPDAEYKVMINEVLGSLGMFGEPTPNDEVDQRIVGSGGSIFLDAHGNPGFITERDAQIIIYHGTRPVGTRAPDITERVVNE